MSYTRVYVRTVEDLIKHLETLPKDIIVCDADSDLDGITVEDLIKHLETLPKDIIVVCDGDSALNGVTVTYCQGNNFLIIQGD